MQGHAIRKVLVELEVTVFILLILNSTTLGCASKYLVEFGVDFL